MAKKHHKFHKMSIEHHKDKSHTVHHMHEDGAHKDVKHAASDLNAVHDSMEQNLGAPNAGEGAPMAQAAPATAPAAPPSPGGMPGGMPGMGA